MEPFSGPLDTGLAGWIIENQRPFIWDDLVAEVDNLPVKMRHTGGEPTRSFIGVPLLGRHGAIGAISIQSYRAGIYNEDDVQLLTTIAAQAAGAIENAQLYIEILEQKDLLDGLLNHAPFAIVINDMESKIRVVNTVFEDLFGYSQSEAIGKDLDDILSTPEIVDSMRALSRKSLKEEQDAYSEGKRRRKDGILLDVEVFTTPYYIGDQQYGYMVFYNENSDRLKAEAERDQTRATYRAILDTLQDPYFEADKSGKITFMNDAYWKNLGYSGKEDVIGKNFRHFTDRKTVRKVFERFQRLYETMKPIEPFDYHYRKKDGSVQTAEIVVSPVFEADEIVGSRGIIRDISVRIKAEEVLRQAKEAAEYRAEELATINRISEVVSHSLDLADILNSACVELTTIFEIRNAGIALLKDDRMSQEIVAFHSAEGEESVLGLLIPLHSNDASSEAMETKKSVVIQDALSDVRVKAMWEVYKRRGTRAIMIVPLLTRGNAIGTIGLPAKDPKHVFTENETELAETIASQIAAAIDNAQLHARTESALDIVERDLEIGRQIQSGFFPEYLPDIPGWDIAAHFQAARQVAGDFYDVFPIGDTKYYGVVIADVCDKGVGAALFMVLLRSLIRSFSEQYQPISLVEEMLLDIATSVNNYIFHIHGHSNMFATLFVGILDPANNKMNYVNGGHDPPVVVGVDGEIKTQLEPTGPAFGFSVDLPFEIKGLEFSPGDLMVAFTDGIAESRDIGGNFYTEERLHSRIAKPWPSAFSVVKHLETDVIEHLSEHQQSDDITLIAIRRSLDEQALYHTYSQKSKLSNLRGIRRFIEEACQSLGVSEEVVESFKLVVDEICSNIIRHGYKGTDDGEIHLKVFRNIDEVLVQIEDTGQSYDPTGSVEPDLNDDINERAIGGLGTYFINEIRLS